MIDYIEITKHLQGKDKLFLGHLQPEAVYSSGWEKLIIQGCERMEFWHNKNIETIKLKGSIMYFWQGHNFTFDKGQFIEGIKYLENLIQLPLFDANVEKFEYGTIIQTDLQPKQFIRNHREGKGLEMYENPKDKGHFRCYSDQNTRLKMYDAGRNIQHKQGLARREIIKEAGWNEKGYFLKWEAHYLKPHVVLNKGKGILLADLINPNWENVFKEDLFIQYQRLIPMKSLNIPTDKKDLSSFDISIRANAIKAMNEGKTFDELRKELYQEINSYPDDILSKADKDHRKRQIKASLDKLKLADKSQWDLSDKLTETLK